MNPFRPMTNPLPHSSQSQRDEWVRRRSLYLAALLLVTLAAVAAFRVTQTPAPPAPMASILPSGALLTIESPDFAALLHRWNASPEQKAWLASDNYSVFSNSRLFGRLNDARAEFEAAAHPSGRSRPAAPAALTPDFLTQVAGRQSIFAWYDIGNLEFLYITRIDAAQAANIALLRDAGRDRASWTPRQSGGVTFYLRKSPAGPAAQAEDAAQSAQGKARTVAFAQTSDQTGGLLLLATREDLIANALQLLHPPPGAPPASQTASLVTEPWYTEASAALPTSSSPALHMVLNLARLVPLPYFRSYWVQQNVSEMKQYRAAVSDLYLESTRFHEERALLLKSPDDNPEAAYLRTLAALAPASGAYTAVATTDSEAAVTALDEKLFGRPSLSTSPAAEAPNPSLEAPSTGSSADLETRIDTPAPVTPATSNQLLVSALKAAKLESVLTWSAAQPPATPSGLWVPIRSAVVLQSSAPLNPQTLQAALQQSLRGSLTTSNLGIEFRAETIDGLQADRSSAPRGTTIYLLTGPKPLFFSTLDSSSPSTSPSPLHLCLFTDDRATLLDMIKQASTLALLESRQAPIRLTRLAAFDHASQRAPYTRLTTLIDGTNQASATPTRPVFFSQNIRSLSASFSALTSEQFTERRNGPTLRQTVTYQWQAP